MAAVLAPFGSVGGTAAATMARATATVAPVAQATESAPEGVKALTSPFSLGMERELEMFVLSRPEDGHGSRGGCTAVVREAQRRARRRALSERKRKAAARERKLEDLEVRMTAAHGQGVNAVELSLESAEGSRPQYNMPRIFTLY